MRRFLFFAAIVIGASYCLAAWGEWSGAWVIAWKGAGVALLAAWAAASARGSEGRVVAWVLAFGAAGDVLIDAAGLVAGAAAFLAGHVLASIVYLRHRRSDASVVVAGGYAAAVAIAGYALGGDPAVAIYALALGCMAAAAWASGFPRRVAAGAALFVASDLLIFAGIGPLAESAAPRLLVWPLYFAGQALIAAGAVAAADRMRPVRRLAR